MQPSFFAKVLSKRKEVLIFWLFSFYCFQDFDTWVSQTPRFRTAPRRPFASMMLVTPSISSTQKPSNIIATPVASTRVTRSSARKLAEQAGPHPNANIPKPPKVCSSIPFSTHFRFQPPVPRATRSKKSTIDKTSLAHSEIKHSLSIPQNPLEIIDELKLLLSTKKAPPPKKASSKKKPTKKKVTKSKTRSKSSKDENDEDDEDDRSTDEGDMDNDENVEKRKQLLADIQDLVSKYNGN